MCDSRDSGFCQRRTWRGVGGRHTHRICVIGFLGVGIRHWRRPRSGSGSVDHRSRGSAPACASMATPHPGRSTTMCRFGWRRLWALCARRSKRARPDAKVRELRSWLESTHGVRVSHPVMWKVVGRLGLTLKKSTSGPRSGTTRTSSRRTGPGPSFSQPWTRAD
jgi:hypothetical protein